MKTLLSALVMGLTFAAAGTAIADDSKWVVKFGVADVEPKSNNGDLANGTLNTDIGNSVRPSVTLEYMFTPNLGLEVLGAWPFRNDIRLNGVKSGSVNVLPPTLSLQYHFLPEKTISPFIGVGINYAYMYRERTKGPIDGAKLRIDNSWGVAAHFGVDFKLDKSWLMTVDARWIDMDSDVKVNGSKVGTVHVDPWVWGIAIGYRF